MCVADKVSEQTRSLTDANNLQKQRGEGLESQIRQIQASIATAQNEARIVSFLLLIVVIRVYATELMITGSGTGCTPSG